MNDFSMKIPFKPKNFTGLLLSLCALLAACESKEEKAARAQEEQQAAENAKVAVDKGEVDKFFRDVKRTPVDLSEPVMAQIRASTPQRSVQFEDETPEMTADGDGAVSACSPQVALAIRREHCFGKVLVAQGAVGRVFSDGFELLAKGLALAVRTTPEHGVFKTDDLVKVRGLSVDGDSQGFVFLDEPSIEKVTVEANPLHARLQRAVTFARLCHGSGVVLDIAPGELPADVGEVAFDVNDPQGGSVMIEEFPRKIDNQVVPHLMRCAIKGGKVVGAQIRPGKIVARKAIVADAAGQWENPAVVDARIKKAADAQWYVDRAASREREKEYRLAEQDLRNTLGKINRAPDSMERTLAAADCLMALDKAERSVANWNDAKIHCRVKAQSVPGISLD
jgi:hypothetical protein